MPRDSTRDPPLPTRCMTPHPLRELARNSLIAGVHGFVTQGVYEFVTLTASEVVCVGYVGGVIRAVCGVWVVRVGGVG